MMKISGWPPIGRNLAWLILLLLLGACAAEGQALPPVSPAVGLAPTAQKPTATAGQTPPTCVELPATLTATAIPDLASTARPSATDAPSATFTATSTLTASPTPTASPTLGPTPDDVVRELRVPILMYHYISEPPADADIYRRDNSVTPARFESHLQYLRTAGYETITLDDLLNALARGSVLPAKSVILTFDDGYEDNYTSAFPLLAKYGMVAHFFVLTDVVNARTPGYMNWSQIEEMAETGQRFGSHGRDHSQSLRGKSVDFLVWHALGGMEALAEHLGYHPRWIAYPSGEYDAQTIAVYKSAHYWGALSTRQGATHTLDDIFALKRVRVRGSYTAENLANLLTLDW